MKVRGLLCGLMTLIALPLGAGGRLTMTASPAVSFAPTNLIVRAVVEADPENRWMEIIADSADFYRASSIQLEGEKAPRTIMFEFRSLPPGTYHVRAVVIGSGGQPRASAQQHVSVIGSGVGH
jgi:hypothetical protein